MSRQNFLFKLLETVKSSSSFFVLFVFCSLLQAPLNAGDKNNARRSQEGSFAGKIKKGNARRAVEDKKPERINEIPIGAQITFVEYEPLDKGLMITTWLKWQGRPYVHGPSIND